MNRVFYTIFALLAVGTNAQPENFYPTECRMTLGGHEYAGYQNKTNSGKTCQRWDENAPHANYYMDSPERFPDPTVSAAENFCRNPTPDWHTSAWCYTTDPATRWQSCDIPLCECKISPDGRDYGGRVSVTASGRTCQEWDEQEPHPHNFTNKAAFVVSSASLDRNMNYCRNPTLPGGVSVSHPGGPWCYTTESTVEWEYCNITECDLSSIRITTTTIAPTTVTTTTTTSTPPTTTTLRTTTTTTSSTDSGKPNDVNDTNDVDDSDGDGGDGDGKNGRDADSQKEPGIGASTDDENSKPGSAAVGAIVGGVIGGCLLILIIVLLVLFRGRLSALFQRKAGNPTSFDNLTYASGSDVVKLDLPVAQSNLDQQPKDEDDAGYVTMDSVARKQ